ncbi:MBL fold metallo-hydrolase [Clostridium sartagoforme]|uniref:ComEC/Rec2 family competence protein n=1 Tax=Clostridium sartagoforme TaxID=84031 RepID=UPI0031E100CB
MKIHFLNVGHGDTSFIEFNGVYMLIDCKISSKEDTVFKYIDDIIPEAEDNNSKKKLDYLVITHTDRDHITGLDVIDENFEIGEIWESGFRRSDDAEESAEYDKLLELVAKINSKTLSAGSSKLTFKDTNVDAYCLCSKSNDNDDVHYNSLVIKFVEGNKSIIFAGDSNCEAWKNKVVKYYSSMLDADVLHASHHGSRTFFFEDGQDKDKDEPYKEGIDSISPDITIISGCDREDKVKEDWPPHDDAISIYEECTSSTGGVYITGEEGNLVFELTNTEIEFNESASQKYTILKGKAQRYNTLKKPFTPGTEKPQYRITRDSFGN